MGCVSVWFSPGSSSVFESFTATGSARSLPSRDVLLREELSLFEVEVGCGFTVDSEF